MTRARKIAIASVAVAGAALAVGAVVWTHKPKPPPPDAPQQDTGYSRTKTEEQMRAIGYVQ